MGWPRFVNEFNRSESMIIWGSKAKESQIGMGTFFCPHCMIESPYAHMRVSRYFTLYFIPLFPTSALAEYVRCGTCKAQFQDVVLKWTRDEILNAVQPWTCANCSNRNPGNQSTCVSCGGPKVSAPPVIQSAPPPVPPQ
jgi:hypothetical protein